MKSIPVSKTTWRKLKKIKKKKGFRVLNQVVEYLVDNEENETLPAGEAKEEVKPKNITPVAPKATLSDVYKVEDSLEKERHNLEKLRDEIRYEETHAENVRAAEELQHAITNRIHAQDSYKNTMKEMARTEEIFRKKMDDFCSELDKITRAINNSKLRKNAYSVQLRTQP